SHGAASGLEEVRIAHKKIQLRHFGQTIDTAFRATDAEQQEQAGRVELDDVVGRQRQAGGIACEPVGGPHVADLVNFSRQRSVMSYMQPLRNAEWSAPAPSSEFTVSILSRHKE